MLKYFFILFLLLVGFSKTYVFYLEKQYFYLKKAIKKQEQDIKLLEIEWMYLNQNERLQYLAETLLPDWQLCSIKQLKSLNSDFVKDE